MPPTHTAHRVCCSSGLTPTPTPSTDLFLKHFCMVLVKTDWLSNSKTYWKQTDAVELQDLKKNLIFKWHTPMTHFDTLTKSVSPKYVKWIFWLVICKLIDEKKWDEVRETVATFHSWKSLQRYCIVSEVWKQNKRDARSDQWNQWEAKFYINPPSVISRRRPCYQAWMLSIEKTQNRWEE